MLISDLLLHLHERKRRITKARKKLLLLLSRSHVPLSASEILKEMKVNKTTIYRELEFLKREGLVIPVNLSDSVLRFEIAQPNHHHHLVCTSCHDIQDVPHPTSLDQETALLERQNRFKIYSHHLEFFGLCNNCQQ